MRANTHSSQGKTNYLYTHTHTDNIDPGIIFTNKDLRQNTDLNWLLNLGKSLCSAVSTAVGFFKSQMEPPVPETLNIVPFLHRCGQHGSALCLLFITKSSEMLSNPASYGYTAPFCWILYFPLVPKSSQQPQNIHHLRFSPLLLCFHAIIGPFVEIIQTTGQNWRLWKLIWMERRAGLVDGVSVTALANVKQIWLFFSSTWNLENCKLDLKL